MGDVERIQAILAANADKEFVQRIVKPDESPEMDLGKGVTGTHLMAAEVDEEGVWRVFPTIVSIEGRLQKLEVNEAFHHALSTNEFIDFGEDKDSAIWFSKNYKKVWQ